MKQLASIALLLFAALLTGPRALAAQPADARSVHFEWSTDAPAVTFYNECTPTKSTNGTYFCVCAFDSGYMGIQQVEDGSKKAIFSVWDSDDDKAPSADKQVKVLYCAPDVKTERFGGEGTGQQSFYDFPWEIGQTYKFFVRARPVGNSIRGFFVRSAHECVEASRYLFHSVDSQVHYRALLLRRGFPARSRI